MSALLQRAAAAINGDQPSANGAATVSRETPVYWLPLERVQDNPYQPRQHYDAEHILNLALSIKQLKRELPTTRGLQQLPLARLGKLATAGEFDAIPRLLYSEPLELRRLVGQHDTVAQLMFGHSRLRAFRVLAVGLGDCIGRTAETLHHAGIDIDLAGVEGFQTTYADLLDPDDDYAAIPLQLGFALDIAMWQHAITENSQRKNINAIEEAQTMARAQQEFGLTDEEAGKPFGYARSTAANKMRLLNLPEGIQRDIATGVLTERHGRELLRLADDKGRMVKVYTTARKKGQTVAQVTEAVNWEAKALKEEQDKQRQLDAARAILEAGWTPPGSADPLPADRVRGDGIWPSFFESSDAKALLTKGICGSHCACCVLGYKQYYPDSTIRPDADQAPNICVGCEGGFEIRKQKQDALAAMRRQGKIEPSEVERRVAEERAQRKAAADEFKRQGRERWERALAKVNRAELWQDIRFWRLYFESQQFSLSQTEDAAKKSQTIQELLSLMLERLLLSTYRYNQDLNEHVPDLADLDRLITALTQPLDKPAQPGPGEDQP